MFERTQLDDQFTLAYMKLTLEMDLENILLEYEIMCKEIFSTTGLAPVPFSVERIYKATELLGTKSVVIVPWAQESVRHRAAEQRLERLKARVQPNKSFYAVACLGSILDVD